MAIQHTWLRPLGRARTTNTPIVINNYYYYHIYLSDKVLGDVTGADAATTVVASPRVLMEVQEPKRSTKLREWTYVAR